MKFKLILNLIAYIFCGQIIYCQNFPGGVTGAEVWYIANQQDVSNNTFLNSAQTSITLSACETFENSLFNFNPSINGNICLNYLAPLENTNGRNVFFVGEPINIENSFSHLGTLWNFGLNNITNTNIIIENFFDLNNLTFYNKYLSENYISNKNARVNFYNISNFDIDRKYKSYGQIGETSFYIGKLTTFDSQGDYTDNDYKGNFPEFISFPRKLSTNERDRIESYLALKYGLTLSPNLSYRSSENIVFWNQANNIMFRFRVFGFGKDAVSSLNQLQSESSHFKNFLQSAIGPILSTNIQKQAQINLPDGNFLVYGDNNRKLNIKGNTVHGVSFLERVWLAQLTGDNSNFSDISFRLFLTPQLLNIQNYLQTNPDKTLWLIKDNFVNNTEVSSFNDQNIEYYEVDDLNLNNGIALFKHIAFDPDNNSYDQFTFGVGSKLIVQVQQNCKGDKIVVVINGGEGPYHITLIPDGKEPQSIMLESGNQYETDVVIGLNYTVVVSSNDGLESTTSFTTESYNINVNLGSDQSLTSSQPEITLNAGTFNNVLYQWYYEGQLIPNNSTSTYTVSEPGNYSVIVTSDDGSCSDSDSININSEQNIYYTVQSACDEELNYLEVIIEDGIGPFITTITGTNTNYSQVHYGNTIVDNLPYGNYSVTTTDNLGNTYTESISFTSPMSTPYNINLSDQLLAICPSGCLISGVFQFNEPITLDASLLINDPLANYEWFANGISLGIYTAQITLSPTLNDCVDQFSDPIMYSVVVTNPITLCSSSDEFTAKGYCPDESARQSNTTSQPETNNNLLQTKVFPNPSNLGNNFNYQAYSDKSFEGTVQLVSMTGAVIETWDLHGQSSYTLQMKALSAGVYLVKLSTERGTITDRVIIK